MLRPEVQVVVVVTAVLVAIRDRLGCLDRTHPLPDQRNCRLVLRRTDPVRAVHPDWREDRHTGVPESSVEQREQQLVQLAVDPSRSERRLGAAAADDYQRAFPGELAFAVPQSPASVRRPPCGNTYKPRWAFRQPPTARRSARPSRSPGVPFCELGSACDRRCGGQSNHNVVSNRCPPAQAGEPLLGLSVRLAAEALTLPDDDRQYGGVALVRHLPGRQPAVSAFPRSGLPAVRAVGEHRTTLTQPARVLGATRCIGLIASCRS